MPNQPTSETQHIVDHQRQDATPQAYLDANGTLRIDLGMTGKVVAPEFDEQEVFVFRDLDSQEILGFEIHSFDSYWIHHLDELEAHLAKYTNGKAAASLGYFRQRAVLTTTPPYQIAIG
jgi:hypothetical protein